MNTKFYWHIHHEILVELLTEPLKNRIAYIKRNKPKGEIKLRLRLLRPVKGKLSKEVVKADQARDKAYQAWDKADQARDKAYQAWDKAYQARDKADQARDKAYQAWDKADQARDKAIEKHKDEIEALHKKECPKCPWNGKTIFPRKRI